MVKLCKQPLENAPSALNEHSSIEVLVNVPSATDSAAHPAEVASSSPIITFLDSLISVPLTSDSAMKRTANIPSNSNLSPTQNAGSNPSEVASVTIPSWHESLVDLSERASDNVSLTHTSVVHFSQEHSSDVHRSAIALFRRSSPSVSAMCSLSIHQSQEHLENDSSTENAGVASAQEGSSNNFHSGLEFDFHILVFTLAATALTQRSSYLRARTMCLLVHHKRNFYVKDKSIKVKELKNTVIDHLLKRSLVIGLTLMFPFKHSALVQYASQC